MAASATTTATKCILRRDFHSSPAKNSGRCYYISFPTKPHKFHIRNSGDTATETESEESPVEIQKKGLISSLNVEKALRGIPITETDHYGILGIQRGCSYDEVTIAYKKKVEELMKKEGEGEGEVEEDELNKKLEVLKESHSILSTVEDRRLYDWSLARSEKVDTYIWPFEVDITQTQSPETPPIGEPENEEPTKLVGYFMFAWLVLGFTLSIALNR